MRDLLSVCQFIKMKKNLHASCVAKTPHGILIVGNSGSGKSDLALRLVGEGYKLVADDQVTLQHSNNQILASPPPRLAGLLEVRGVGILKFDYHRQHPISLVVELVKDTFIERLPDLGKMVFGKVELPSIKLHPFEPSALIKLKLVLGIVTDKIIRIDD